MTAGLLDEAVDLAQPQARTFADFLCGEERVERLGDHAFGHTGTGVGNGDKDVLARKNAHLVCYVALIERRVLRFNGDAPAIRHGIASVDRQV